MEEDYLRIIIEYYQRNLDKYFPDEKLGIADRFLFNKVIIDVAYQNSSFNKFKQIDPDIQSVLNIMEGYGFKANFRKERIKR